MVSIHGLVYLITGVAVALGSYLIDKQTQTQHMTVFILIGGCFILVGIGKLLWNGVFANVSERGDTMQGNVKMQRAKMHKHSHQTHSHHNKSHSGDASRHPHKHQVSHHSARHYPKVTCPHCHKQQFKVGEHCAYCHKHF